MKHKTGIVLSSVGVVAFALSFLMILVSAHPNLLQNDLVKTFYNPLSKAGKTAISTATSPSLEPASSETMFQLINQYRIDNELDPFEKEKSICTDQTLETSDVEALSEDEVFSVCADCSHTAVITLQNIVPKNIFLSQLKKQKSAQEIILDPELTHLCVKKDRMQTILMFTAYHPQPSPLTTQVETKVDPTPPIKVTNFTEDELWQALVDYRHAHKKPDLNRNESLCSYARERVEQHIQMFKDKSKDEYPVEEKYPLDAHRGFSADAQSGYAFEKTGMHELAENLAYWPTAKSPVHIIEWGWDTSTEGHRETQLTEKYYHACITGRDGFYVALFGN